LKPEDFDKFKAQGASFSPVFNPHKAGNVVNMGNINANDVLLIGNKVSIDGGHINGKHNDNVSGDALKNPSGNTADKIHLVGNYINLDLAKVNFNSKENLISADKSASVSISTENYYNQLKNNKNDPFKKYNFQKGSYGDVKSKDIEQFASIGSDRDWFFFAKSWNETDVYKKVSEGVNEYRLVSDINFGGDEGRNYANYCIEGLGCTNMMIANYVKLDLDQPSFFTHFFSKTFDGQGYTLRNINIDISNLKDTSNYGYYGNVGIFSTARGATFRNINVDYEYGGINAYNKDIGSVSLGGFIGGGALSSFENIAVNNLGDVKLYASDNAYFGGFAGIIHQSNLDKIFVKTDGSIYVETRISTPVGGFAGSIQNGSTLSNIILDSKSDIHINQHGGNVYSDSAYIGGFAGTIIQIEGVNGINKINNVQMNYSGDIILEKFTDAYHFGGFAGYVTSLNLSDVVFDFHGTIQKKFPFGTIGGFIGTSYDDASYRNITANFHNRDIFGGGFVGYVAGDRTEFDNILLSNTKNTSGGFVGNIGHGDFIFKNITLENIYDTNAGFVGGISNYSGNVQVLFNGISMNNVNFRKAGFVESMKKENSNYNINVDFKHIYIFLDENPQIGNENNVGKFYTHNDANINFNDVHIYHHENDLSNAAADQNSWGSTSDKIQIHTYNNSNKGKFEEDFTQQANAIPKPMLPDVIPPLKPPKPTIPPDIDVVLDSDDVISAEDLNKWLDEIFGGNYWVDIKDLGKIQGLSESIAQSISFLEALYGQKGMKEILEKFHDDYKTAYSKYDKFKTDKANLLAFINDKLKPLVESSNNALAQLKLIQDQLKIAIAKYNDYVKKINENPAIKNEETLNALKAEVDRLNQLSGELATTIANNQIQLEAWQDKASTDSNEHFTIKGQFDNVALLIPDLEKVTANGNENDDYEKISRQVANLQKQTPIFEYEDEETEEVDETSLAQKNKTCIVSDNYKTMNPCIVGGL
ncbi:hypothetical protein IDR50_001531, partial [Campylobacter lari]|nr:hypothetical protein [Campylobacter lari]